MPPTLASIDIAVRESNNSVKDTYLRGIYMREKHQTEKAMDFVVGVQPKFKQQSGVSLPSVPFPTQIQTTT